METHSRHSLRKINGPTPDAATHHRPDLQDIAATGRRELPRGHRARHRSRGNLRPLTLRRRRHRGEHTRPHGGLGQPLPGRGRRDRRRRAAGSDRAPVGAALAVRGRGFRGKPRERRARARAPALEDLDLARRAARGGGGAPARPGLTPATVSSAGRDFPAPTTRPWWACARRRPRWRT